MSKATFNGYEVIIYGYFEKDNVHYADCYFPELDTREDIITSSIELSII